MKSKLLTEFVKELGQSLNFSIFDASGKYLHISPCFANCFGRNASDLIGLKLENLSSNFHNSEFWCQTMETIKTNHVWKGEVLRRNFDNKEFYTQTTITPFKAIPEWGDSFIEFHYEITKYKKIEFQIEQQSQTSLTNSRYILIGQMLSGIAHEINNSLTIVLGTTKYFKITFDKGAITSELVSKGCDKITSASDRIVKSIKMIKSFTGNNVVASFLWVSVQKLIMDVNLFIGAKIKNHGIAFEISEEIAESILIYCQPNEIPLALINLIMLSDRVLKETENPWIKLSYEYDVKWSTFRVSDNRILNSLESYFTEVTPTISKNLLNSNTDHGLNVIKGIAMSHKGQLFIEQDSKCTSFVLRIPNPN